MIPVGIRMQNNKLTVVNMGHLIFMKQLDGESLLRFVDGTEIYTTDEVALLVDRIENYIRLEKRIN